MGRARENDEEKKVRKIATSAPVELEFRSSLRDASLADKTYFVRGIPRGSGGRNIRGRQPSY